MGRTTVACFPCHFCLHRNQSPRSSSSTAQPGHGASVITTCRPPSPFLHPSLSTPSFSHFLPSIVLSTRPFPLPSVGKQAVLLSYIFFLFTFRRSSLGCVSVRSQRGTLFEAPANVRTVSGEESGSDYRAAVVDSARRGVQWSKSYAPDKQVLPLNQACAFPPQNGTLLASHTPMHMRVDKRTRK